MGSSVGGCSSGLGGNGAFEPIQRSLADGARRRDRLVSFGLGIGEGLQPEASLLTDSF